MLAPTQSRAHHIGPCSQSRIARGICGYFYEVAAIPCSIVSRDHGGTKESNLVLYMSTREEWRRNLKEVTQFE